MGKKKRNSIKYDLDFTITGHVPTSERGTKDTEALKDFQKVLKDTAKDVSKSLTTFPIASKDRVVVTIVQLLFKQKGFLSGQDVDNAAKTILDPLEGVLFDNDGQVVTLLSSKLFDEGATQDITYIGIKRVPSNTQYDDIIECGGVQHALNVCKQAQKVL